jgi:hypothetical protein
MRRSYQRREDGRWNETKEDVRGSVRREWESMNIEQCSSRKRRSVKETAGRRGHDQERGRSWGEAADNYKTGDM